MKKIIYVSGKIEPRGNDTGTMAEYIDLGKNAAVKLWNMGYTVICPHGNTDFDMSKITIAWSEFLIGDLQLLENCDVIFMLENWKNSNGAKIEHEYALENNIPIIYTFKAAKIFVKKHPARCYITGRIRTGLYKKIENHMVSPCMKDKIQDMIDSRVLRLYNDFSLTPKLNSNSSRKQDKKQVIRR